jgi:flagellar motility protein MotE (MotC chaperone)
MRATPRLIPLLIFAATIMLTVRLGMVWHDAGLAFAQAEPAKPAADPAKPAASPSESGKPETAPAPAGGETQPGAPAAAETARPKAPPHFSAAEVEVLQELAKRRDTLDQRQADQDRRELTLKAAEQRIDGKIAQLKDLQTRIDAQIAKSEAADDERIKSLVHIYENMKPKDAATIFEGMELPSLLQLLTRMKDLKTAPILAAMAPDKARAVTIAMAQHEDLPNPKSN